MEHDLNDTDALGLLTEEQLKQMSRHIKNLVPQRGQDGTTQDDIK